MHRDNLWNVCVFWSPTLPRLYVQRNTQYFSKKYAKSYEESDNDDDRHKQKKNKQNENKLLENANDTKHTVENVSFCTSLSTQAEHNIPKKKMNNLMSCVSSSLFAVALALIPYLLPDAL